MQVVKVGFAGEPAPRVRFPNVVGRALAKRRHGSENMSHEVCTVMSCIEAHAYATSMLAYSSPPGCCLQDVLVGSSCSTSQTPLQMTYPMQGSGMVQSWEDLGLVLDHALKELLRIDLSEHKVLLTMPTVSTKAYREKLLQSMFDYGATAVAMQSTGPLALFSQGGDVCSLMEE